MLLNTDDEPIPVCRIGEAEYADFDEAVRNAEDGATIVLLTDCSTDGLNLSKDLIIDGGEDAHKLTFEKYGIALWGKALLFKNCTVEMKGIGSTPYTAEWSWMAICANKNASLSLDNTKMTMDGSGAGNAHAIYFCSNNKLNIENSELTIRNYPQDALEWDGGDGGYNVNIKDSVFLSDHNRSGFTGTFVASIDHSTVDVINSTGNGSNGSHFEIVNESEVNFNDNKDHGLSAGRLTIDNSTVTANGNGANGISTTGILKIQNQANVTIQNNDCSISSKWTIPGALLVGNGASKIDSTSKVVIQDNRGSGILLKAGNLTIEDGADVVITRNYADKLGLGGGVHNYGAGTLSIAESVQLYNNHAPQAGDDIYNAASAHTVIGNVGFDWALDGEPDCLDAIDGWYDDAEDARWEAHNKPYHIVQLQPRDYAIAGVTALKAAHGIDIPDTPYEPSEPLKYETSKSKEATNLDENYESKVTLSLPAAEAKIKSDVVFVLDYSTCNEPVQEEAFKMLESLSQKISGKNAIVNVGAVVFRGEATEYPLTELNSKNLETIESFMSTVPAVKGSNMHAGLLKAQEMLENDTTVEDSCKYLILVSDGITYLWDEDGESVGINSEQIDGTAKAIFRASPDSWRIKYGNEEAPDNWKAYFSSIQNVNTAIETYAEKYDREAEIKAYIPWSLRENFPSTVDVALYKSYELYTTLEVKYQCYALQASTDKDSSDHPWGPSFMEYLAGGREVSFDDIRNDIYYLLDAGSRIEDYIGYAKDNYDFDFVNDIEKLSMKVGGVELAKTKIDDHTYGFGASNGSKDGKTYPYILSYEKGNGTDGEHFTWHINYPVSIDQSVQLTYTVQLINPKTEAGTYGEYDRFGENKKPELYTNSSATLFPVDTNGKESDPEEFNKPTVSYTVAETPVTPDPEPVVPTPDPEPQPQPETAQIQITKQVQNKGGNAVNVDKTFYAAIFTDSAYQNRYGDVIALTLSNGSEATQTVTVDVPKDGTELKYYIMETDKDGKLVQSGEDFGYQITIKGSEAVVSAEKLKADVTIINKEVEKSSGGKHHHSSSDSSDDSTPVSTPASVTSAQTGDSNNILLPVLLLLLAVALLGGYGVVMYRKKNRS